MYAGSRFDLAQTEMSIQIDVHGPESGNNVHVIETLFRSEYAVDVMNAFGVSVVPMFCSDSRQAPFVNDQEQVEYRWTLDAHVQINSTVRTPQQFLTEVEVAVIEAATQYTGP